jgi:NADH-quinone oxidoreductase subunit L
MTHAFFKALMFMAAGSVIAAMAGVQDIDRMSGLRRAMPFTYAAFVIGALALAAFPVMSGYFSKDDILAFAAERGGGYWILYVVGTIAALMTAVYAFRMIFRVFFGEPNDEARSLEEGHLAHGEPVNPMTGEPEDTDVGFPGPEHHIAEWEPAMRTPMSLLAILAIVGGVVQIPQVTHVVSSFLEPSFADSRFANLEPSGGTDALSLSVGAAMSLAGIGIAYFVWIARPGTSARVVARFRLLHGFLSHKWYFDEAYDLLIVRPMTALGRAASTTFERVVIGGMAQGATVAVRAGNSIVRVAQSGLLRNYALLLMTGVTALGLYFLIVAH